MSALAVYILGTLVAWVPAALAVRRSGRPLRESAVAGLLVAVVWPLSLPFIGASLASRTRQHA